ncbi:serine/threonine-protein kinase DCLK3 [Puma concolor]|uniref:non-specific serine/threonine protein kinase n=1 Tax=Puma concolor TaxID=9696 RepID=A0A6P6H1P1_PUMCO|nr:serine/threonine-protein kinase DCLK3 [Puma concolor]
MPGCQAIYAEEGECGLGTKGTAFDPNLGLYVSLSFKQTHFPCSNNELVSPGNPGCKPSGWNGRGSLCDHSLKSLSSRITVRKLQGTWLPAGCGNLEKPLLGPRGSVAPVLGPQNGLHPVHAESSPLKPRVVTVVKLGGHPLRKVTLLLNRRSVQSFEQLLADISEALGFPRWKNDRVRKLFNLKGKEIRSVSDFFREGDAFIAMGKEPLTLKNIQVAVEELYPSKARALTLTQHSRAPSPRLRSRLYSRALRGGHHCGESDAAKGRGEAGTSKAAPGHRGQAPVEPAPEDRARPQKKWVGGKREPEPASRPPKEAALDRPASGEKHLGVEIERTSGEIIRCEKCRRERELQQGLQRERLSLGTSELDLGKSHRYEAAAEKLVRTRSCRRSPEAHPAAGEEGGRAESHRSSPRNPTQEPRKPGRHPDKKEDRDPEGQEGHAQAAAKARREPGDAPPVREEGLRDARREARSACGSRQGGFSTVPLCLRLGRMTVLWGPVLGIVQRNEDKSTTLKLADFGLAKHVVRPIFTVCGTPTYVAPEILSEKGYGLEVDMWAAGVILYILLCGFPPFRSPERDQDELFNIIQLGRFEFLAPYWDNISDAAKDLVSRLLVVDPKKRYTAHQVLQHPWIETAGKTGSANLPKEVPPSSEGHVRSQHRRSAEKAL